MGALIGASVALSPYIVTIGSGLVGFGAAAYKSIGPVFKAAQATGGLQANMAKLDPEQQSVARSLLALGKQYDAFAKSLQPQVLNVFNKGIQLTGHLMHDLQPVSKATGIALGVMLDRIDKEFQSGQWQTFFAWMAKNAGPDVQLLGDSFIRLMDALPQILIDLQPVARLILQVTDAVAQILGPVARFIQLAEESNRAQLNAAKSADSWVTKLTNSVPGFKAVNDSITADQDALKRLFGIAPSAGDATKKVGDKAATAAMQVQSMARAVKRLSDAESQLGATITWANLLVTAKDDAVSLSKALKASHDSVGLHTAAQRNSFTTASTYISDLLQMAQGAGKNKEKQDLVRQAIEKVLPKLEAVKGKTSAYKDEIKKLIDVLHNLAKVPPIHESIFMTGHGRWGIFGQGQGQPGIFGSGKGKVLSTGGRIPGYGGGDNVPALLEAGETVVPKHLTTMVAPLMRAYGVPGFAAGGIVPSYSGTPGAPFRNWTTGNWNASITSIEHSMGNAMASAFRSALSAASGGFADTGARSGNAAIAQSFARSILPRGWSFPALLSLWNQESGWNVYAVNASSGAYGIPQSLGHGHPYNLGDYKAQIEWGINYIAGRYGNSQNAWAHEVANNWYDQGGWLPPGASLAYNGTGQPERVLPPGRRDGVQIHMHFEPGSISGDVDVELMARKLAFVLDN